jgi:hypothetical protein
MPDQPALSSAVSATLTELTRRLHDAFPELSPTTVAEQVWEAWRAADWFGAATVELVDRMARENLTARRRAQRSQPHAG